MDLTGIGTAAEAAKGIIGMFFPDRTEEDKAKLAASLALIQAQTDINKTEAASSDPLQHWRGGLGWVCVAGYAWNFVVQPLIFTISQACGHTIAMRPLDISELSTLTLGMLGLGGLHVAERIKGAA
jgi:predicted metal-binding membrane protein